MAQWVNRLWNITFVNPHHYLYCVKFLEPYIYLEQLGLTAGRLAGRQNMGEFYEIFKVGSRSKYLTCRFF